MKQETAIGLATPKWESGWASHAVTTTEKGKAIMRKDEIQATACAHSERGTRRTGPEISRRSVFQAFTFATAMSGLSLPLRAATSFEPEVITIRPANANNFAAVIARGLAKIPPATPVTIRFVKGIYNLRPGGLQSRLLYVSNNDDGNKRIGILLEGRNGVTIEGNGSTIIAHGLLLPIVILDSNNVSMSDLTITWDRPFHCEADVTAAGSGFATMRIPEAFDYEIREKKFVFANEPGKHNLVHNLLEFDAEKRESAFQASDHFLSGWGPNGAPVERPYKVQEVAPRTVRFELPFKTVPKVGNRMLIMPKSRHYSAVVIQHSRELDFQNIHIGCSGAMGFIAQSSHNIALRRCTVSPLTDEHFVSTTVDATHFVNCSGELQFRDCNFLNHIDDAINVHGIYVRVAEVLADEQVKVEFVHRQQRGVRMLMPGDVIAVDDRQSLATKAIGEIAEFAWIDPRFAKVRLSGIDVKKLTAGDVVNNLSRQAQATVTGCHFGKNRARGILLSTGGKIMVSENTFHVPGTAVRISGGVDQWYESGATKDVTIARNVFDTCKYGVWGEALFDIIAVDGQKRKGTTPYHGSVTIAENEIKAIDKLMVSAYRVADIAFTDNRIEHSMAYPKARDVENPYNLIAVKNFNAQGNKAIGYDSNYGAKLNSKADRA